MHHQSEQTSSEGEIKMNQASFIGSVKFNDEYTDRQLENNFPSVIGGDKGDISDFSIGSEGNISGIISSNIGFDLADFFNVVPEILGEFDTNCTKMISEIEIEAVSN